jgi:hypothetical protein
MNQAGAVVFSWFVIEANPRADRQIRPSHECGTDAIVPHVPDAPQRLPWQ